MGQEPYQWLLWRSKISEGMNEADAWQSIMDEQARMLDGPTGSIGGEDDLIFSQSETGDNMAVLGDHGKSLSLADENGGDQLLLLLLLSTFSSYTVWIDMKRSTMSLVCQCSALI